MARGFYADTAARSGDYVIRKDHRGRWRVDRVGVGGTHTTLGKTAGEDSRTNAVALARDDAHIRGSYNPQVFFETPDGLLHFGNIIRGRATLARDRRAPRRDAIDRREASEERAWRSAQPSHRRFSRGEREVLYRGRWESLAELAESQLRAFEAEQDEERESRGRRDTSRRNADLIAWYQRHGELDMPRGFRAEKIQWMRKTNRANALDAVRRMGYRG